MMITDFLNKAENNLLAARICFENGLYDASANRAYYAVFHAALAALSANGIRRETIDHKWVQAEFNGRLIKAKKVYPSSLKSYLADMQTIRNQADYKPGNVSKLVAEKQVRRAAEMIRIIGKELENAQFQKN